MSEAARKIPRENDRKRFMKAIQSGNEVRKYVRIQVIGKEGVGKTSLVRRLLNQDLKGVESTDGIDINRICHIKENDGTWMFDNDETEMEKIVRRILHAVELTETENHPEYDERRFAEHNLFRTNDTKTLNPFEDQIKLAEVDENRDHPSNRLTDEAETLDRNETVRINDNDPVKISITNIPGTSNNNPDDNQLHVVNTINSYADKPMTNTYTNNDSDQITEAMVNKMDEITFYLKNKKETMTDEGLIECGIWDFAGQKEYYATHQTFLTPHAIYLLVADITDDIKKVQYDDQFNFDSSGDYIDFWLDSIHCYCEDIKNSIANEKYPSVIMVCAGIDKLKVSDEDLKIKKNEYQKQFLDIFGCQEKGSHIRGMINFISNINSPEEDFTNLRDQISDIAKEMRYFAEELPTKWIQLENTLAILKDLKKRGKMGYCEKLENIEKLAKAILIEKDELLIFLKFQHKIGNIIFFDDKKDYIILQPNWLVDCFRCLICDNAKKSCTATELYNLNYRGILSDHLIDKLFSKVPELMFGQHKTHILEVMEKFDIVVKPKSMNEYYIPCMITEVSSLENIKAAFKVGNQLCTPWLVLAFKFLPIAYYNHILFMYIREKKVCKEMSDTRKGRPAIYAGKAVVYLDTTKQSKLVICFSRNAISLQIWNNYDMGDNTYRKIVAELCNKIEDLETKVGHKLQYKIKSKCRTGDYSNSVGRISHGDLNTLCVGGQYYCEEHECMHNKEDIENIWSRHNVDTVNSDHNTSSEAADVQEEQANSLEFAVLPDQPIEIKESTAEYKDEIASEIKSINSPQEIVTEPNHPEIEGDSLDARCNTQGAAKNSNTEQITAQVVVSTDLQQKLPRYSQYESMEKRLKSFKSWTSTIKQTPEDLAMAGFFYSGKRDIVQCFFCAGILSEWNDSDVPLKEHKRIYPACPFITKIAITYDAAQYSNTEQITAQKVVSSNLQQKLPRYSTYKSMGKRLKSFKGWTSIVKQTPEDLANAGFFYSGKDDTVQCFFCAGIIWQWNDSDVPIEEHKRLFPACPFITKIYERSHQTTENSKISD
ncbi:uncharacterized protein LOC127710457 isoform X2 [Mytilus californianus]|uniref:uncharacterized protein LOC127710457 isoform X2 n=1 Tax=Mytilus californianus TaxID=6549 RepID=UPI0022481D7A|nr:uncharacterized protein LOC127710457 isoform X2 [Mytilus californianus]